MLDTEHCLVHQEKEGDCHNTDGHKNTLRGPVGPVPPTYVVDTPVTVLEGTEGVVSLRGVVPLQGGDHPDTYARTNEVNKTSSRRALT